MKRFLITIIIIIFSSLPLNAGELKSDILQYKMNRFYFSIGTEALVVPGCQIVFFCDEDSITSTLIKESYEGISISQEVFIDTNDFAINSCYAVIETVEPDSKTNLVIDRAELSDNQLRLLIDQNRYLENEDYPLDYIYDLNENLYIFSNMERWESGSPKIHLYHSQLSTHFLIKTDTLAAPYVITLVPNLRKKINFESMLSTGLYYYFNPKKKNMLFDFNKVNPVNNFWHDTVNSRPFDFNHKKGRTILMNMIDVPEKINLSYCDNNLKKATLYFTGLLAQLKFTVDINENNLDADLFVKSFPYDKNNPLNTFKSILNFIKSNEIKSSSHQETIQIIEKYIEQLSNQPDAANAEHFYKLIDRSLKYDLGIFPLFQPYLYVSYNNEIKYMPPTDTASFSLKYFIKLRLPKSLSEHSR